MSDDQGPNWILVWLTTMAVVAGLGLQFIVVYVSEVQATLEGDQACVAAIALQEQPEGRSDEDAARLQAIIDRSCFGEVDYMDFIEDAWFPFPPTIVLVSAVVLLARRRSGRSKTMKQVD